MTGAPALGGLYQTLAPWTELLLRVGVGLALVPHGLRNTFGFWPSTGVRAHSLTELAQQLDNDGYRPGKFWAPAISVTLAILIFLIVSNYERWRVGGYFWNKTGV